MLFSIVVLQLYLGGKWKRIDRYRWMANSTHRYVFIISSRGPLITALCSVTKFKQDHHSIAVLNITRIIYIYICRLIVCTCLFLKNCCFLLTLQTTKSNFFSSSFQDHLSTHMIKKCFFYNNIFFTTIYRLFNVRVTSPVILAAGSSTGKIIFVIGISNKIYFGKNMF